MIRRLALLLSLLPAAVAAQYPVAAVDDPADRLAGYLRTLAVSPRDVDALTGAGNAALAVGDANAAIGFFARADGLSPGTGRIKAGLGTALLRMGKPADAGRLLDEAVTLGVAEADVASDRGLAWDLRGDPRRAQADYRRVLARGEDAETTRRLALSLGISGDRMAALALLQPLTNRQDPAAWRARAFVLALTGDPTGAGAIASAMMLPGQAAAMQPFLLRLSTLNDANKARAVHFGDMPSEGTSYSPAELAGFGASTAARTYRPESAVPRALAAAAPPPVRPTQRWLRERTALLRAPEPKPAAAPKREELARTVADDTPLVLALNTAKPAVAPVTRGPALSLGLSAPAEAAVPVATAPEPAAKPTPKPAQLAKLEKLPSATEAVAKPVPTAEEKRAVAKKKADEAKKKALAAARLQEEKAAKANPERIWVQVAGGANKADLPKAWDAVKTKSAALLKGKSASTTKVRATNRLLVGPFKDEGAAQELVNKLPGSFIVTTEKGQAVEKLALK